MMIFLVNILFLWGNSYFLDPWKKEINRNKRGENLRKTHHGDPPTMGVNPMVGGAAKIGPIDVTNADFFPLVCEDIF